MHPLKMSLNMWSKIMRENSSVVASWENHRDINFLHIAVIVKRGKVLATAENRHGSRKQGVGYSDRTIHAEKAVVKRLGDTSRLRGASLCVWRVSTQAVMPSKPCHDCKIFLDKCIREYGLRAVYYTDTVLPKDI